MQTKIKIFIVVIIIFALTGIVIGYYLKIKNNTTQIESQLQDTGQNLGKSQSEKTSKVDQPIKKEENKDPQEFSTVFTEGEVVSFENNELEIKNGDVENKLFLIENANIHTRNEKEIVKKETSELKKGAKVRVEIDTKNSMGIAVEIMQ